MHQVIFESSIVLDLYGNWLICCLCSRDELRGWREAIFMLMIILSLFFLIYISNIKPLLNAYCSQSLSVLSWHFLFFLSFY